VKFGLSGDRGGGRIDTMMILVDGVNGEPVYVDGDDGRGIVFNEQIKA